MVFTTRDLIQAKRLALQYVALEKGQQQCPQILLEIPIKKNPGSLKLTISRSNYNTFIIEFDRTRKIINQQAFQDTLLSWTSVWKGPYLQSLTKETNLFDEKYYYSNNSTPMLMTEIGGLYEISVFIEKGYTDSYYFYDMVCSIDNSETREDCQLAIESSISKLAELTEMSGLSPRFVLKTMQVFKMEDAVLKQVEAVDIARLVVLFI